MAKPPPDDLEITKKQELSFRSGDVSGTFRYRKGEISSICINLPKHLFDASDWSKQDHWGLYDYDPKKDYKGRCILMLHYYLKEYPDKTYYSLIPFNIGSFPLTETVGKQFLESLQFDPQTILDLDYRQIREMSPES